MHRSAFAFFNVCNNNVTFAGHSRQLYRLLTNLPMRSSLLISLLIASVTFLKAQSETLDAFINSYVKEHQFNGTILVQQDGEVRFEKSFGLAERSFQVPLNNQTVYHIASVTKLFTSVLILQLCENGKIGLHESIKHYLPDYPGNGGDAVNIHQLLNHTSGLPDMDTTSSMESALMYGVPAYQIPATTEQLVLRNASGELVNPPGQVFSYNNADYILLGKIIETICKQPFDTVLRRKILQPLGMSHSGMLAQHKIIDNLAVSYFYRDDLNALVPNLPVYYENWYAAGSMYSTAEDLLKFNQALFSLKLIGQKSLDLLLTPGLDRYGYGMWIDEYEIGGIKYRAAKRPGLIMGSQAMLLHFLDTDLTVIILSNTGNIGLDQMVKQISIAALGG